MPNSSVLYVLYFFNSCYEYLYLAKPGLDHLIVKGIKHALSRKCTIIIIIIIVIIIIIIIVINIVLIVAILSSKQEFTKIFTCFLFLFSHTAKGLELLLSVYQKQKISLLQCSVLYNHFVFPAKDIVSCSTNFTLQQMPSVLPLVFKNKPKFIWDRKENES